MTPPLIGVVNTGTGRQGSTAHAAPADCNRTPAPKHTHTAASPASGTAGSWPRGFGASGAPGRRGRRGRPGRPAAHLAGGSPLGQCRSEGAVRAVRPRRPGSGARVRHAIQRTADGRPDGRPVRATRGGAARPALTGATGADGRGSSPGVSQMRSMQPTATGSGKRHRRTCGVMLPVDRAPVAAAWTTCLSLTSTSVRLGKMNSPARSNGLHNHGHASK